MNTKFTTLFKDGDRAKGKHIKTADTQNSQQKAEGGSWECRENKPSQLHRAAMVQRAQKQMPTTGHERAQPVLCLREGKTGLSSEQRAALADVS